MKKMMQMLKGIAVGCLITVLVLWLARPLLGSISVTEPSPTGIVKVDVQPLNTPQASLDKEADSGEEAGVGETGKADTGAGDAGEENAGAGDAGEENTGAGETGKTDAGAGETGEENTEAGEDAAVPTPTLEPTPSTVTITLSAAGDCSLGNHHLQEYGLSFVEAYDKAEDEGYFFEKVKDIFSQDDFTIVNLEGTFTTSTVRQEDRTYNIKGDPSYAGILTAGSVEAVSMGNNHRLDYGVSGSNDTVEALEAEGIAYAYDDIVSVTEVKGIRIGYVSVNEVAWGYGSETLVKEGIEKLKEQEVDLIIACCHWGIEKDTYPEAYQFKLGRKCIDMGADLVIGHHPHVLQGIEEYNGKYIIYSLGNFSFGANRNPADKDTMIFQQTFTFVEGELQEDLDARIIPCSVSSVTKRNNFQPMPLEGEEAERVIKKVSDYSKEFGVTIAEDGSLQSAVE